MTITDEFIRSYVSAAAYENGKTLASKGKLISLGQSADGSLFFAECEGSGANNYNCYLDFGKTSIPTNGCTCPSRQIPCKHVSGLLHCMQMGKTFNVVPIPEDIIKKKERRDQRAKDAGVPKKPTKTQASAALKKCEAQLEGLETAEKLLKNIAMAGLASIDASASSALAEQVKQLGNFFIPGIQNSFKELLALSAKSLKSQDYTLAIDKTNYIKALIKKAKEHVNHKIFDLNAYPLEPATALKDTTSTPIEEQIGYAWKLPELDELGLKRVNEEVVQVAFHMITDNVNGMWIDEGIWISLSDGLIFRTQAFRPFRAHRSQGPEDTTFQALSVNDMYVYPGGINPRARWNDYVQRGVEASDLKKVVAFAATDFKEASKNALNQARNPLSEKSPIFSLRVSGVKEGPNGEWAVTDDKGNAIVLKLDGFAKLLKKMTKSQLVGNALVCRFYHDISKSVLLGEPLAVVSAERITRFWS
ncbi:MAG: hypothetical protein LBT59_06700 [Clostridiales bacterium]|nr:hypothetical protein [Clostridiales bacterium]